MTRRTTSQNTGRNRLIAQAMGQAILIAGILVAGVSAGIETASAQAYSADPASQDRYPRSVEAATASNDAPVVLRGSRPAPQTSAEEDNACPAGSIEEPGSGCVSPHPQIQSSGRNRGLCWTSPNLVSSTIRFLIYRGCERKRRRGPRQPARKRRPGVKPVTHP